MEIKSVSYEELRTRYFTRQMRIHESLIEEFKKCTLAKEDFLSDEGMKAQFYRDALNALNWIKIEYDEEGKLVSFPSEGECAVFCRKDGGIFIDEVCADDIEDGYWPVYLDGGIDIDDLVAWMPLPKPYKENK